MMTSPCAPEYTEQAPAIPKERQIRISEIYASVQGESLHVGKPCVFVRFTGCNLRCTWCDSVFTFTGGTHRDLEEVAQEAHGFGIHTIEVTGGEPLVQRNASALMARLLELGHEVLLETSGSRDISGVPKDVHIICDFKPPASGEASANLWSNVEHLDGRDEVKFVIADRQDYEWCKQKMSEYRLADRVAAVQFSPVWGAIEPVQIAEWLVEDKLRARLQLQLHKVLWDPDARGV